MPDPAEQINPQHIFTTLIGFKRTAVLRTAFELRLFDALSDQPTAADEVARRIGNDPRATGFLLETLASTGVLAAGEDGFRLVPGSAELLSTSSPRYVGGITRIAASEYEWEAFGQLAETVRTGAPLSTVDPHAPDFGFWVDGAESVTPAAARGAVLVADLLDPWLRARQEPAVLDAGCGSGVFGLALAQRHPGLRLTLQDWPAVAQVAQRNAKLRELDDRVTLSPGDIFGDGLTGGPYDVVIAGNLLFLYEPAQAAALVRRLAGALKPGGRLVIASFMAGDGAEHTHLLNLLMLSWAQGAQLLSPQEYQDMAAAAGLTDITAHRREGVPLQAVLASRPAGEEGLS